MANPCKRKMPEKDKNGEKIIMKKRISLILTSIILVTMLIGCGKSKDIKLTTDNYSDYLTISCSSVESLIPDGKNGIRQFRVPDGTLNGIICSNALYLSCSVEGASPNFVYNNVEVTLKVTATERGYVWSKIEAGAWAEEAKEERKIEHTFTIDTNVSGNMKENCERDKYIKLDDYVVDSYTAAVSCDYEIVDIKGTVTPVE